LHDTSSALISHALRDSGLKLSHLPLALSVFQALPADKETELNHTLQQVAQSRRVMLQWIPAHCGISGNVVADELAKKGATKEQFMLCFCHSVCHSIQQYTAET
jgi:hypothetical protein